MKITRLMEIVREVIEEEIIGEVEPGQRRAALGWGAGNAGDEAKKMGLDYLGFGRYGKDGKTTHQSVDGKLTPVDQIKPDQPASKPNTVQTNPAQSAQPTPPAAASDDTPDDDKIDRLQTAVDNIVYGNPDFMEYQGSDVEADKFMKMTGLTEPQMAAYTRHVPEDRRAFSYDSASRRVSIAPPADAEWDDEERFGGM